MSENDVTFEDPPKNTARIPDELLDEDVYKRQSLLHAVVAIRIQEIVDDGDRLIMAFLSLYFVGVNDNLGMEDLLLYALCEVCLLYTSRCV